MTQHTLGAEDGLGRTGYDSGVRYVNQHRELGPAGYFIDRCGSPAASHFLGSGTLAGGTVPHDNLKIPFRLS